MPDLKKKYTALKEWDKVEFLMQIEFETREGIWELLNDIILDPNDYDLARVQALKILEIADVATPHKAVLATSLAHVLKQDEDDDVRDYAAIAARNFMEFEAVASLAVEILMDPAENINIRSGVFSAIVGSQQMALRNQVLTQLLNDPEFAKSAARYLGLH